VYVFVSVPALTPVIIPEVRPIEAKAMLLLVHVPPVVASAKAAMPFTQTVVVPAIAAGFGLTVTVNHAIQPVGSA
jgi:hypothetical protein